MSTDKNGSKRSSTTKEKNSLSKTSKRNDSKERTSKKIDEAQKSSTETQEEKKLTKKSNISTKDSEKATNLVSLKRSVKRVDKPLTNTESKTSVNLNRSLNKTKTNTSTASSSSKVQKSQYFPTKNLYSNALKSVEKQSKILNDKTETSNRKHDSKNIEKLTPRLSVVKKTTRNVNSKPGQMKHLSKGSSLNSTKTYASPDNDKQTRTPRDSSPETSSAMERPRTATLRKGSIVNENIVGPEAPKQIKIVPVIKESVLEKGNKTPNTSSPIMLKSDDNYEDDFESYESDFETETSSEDTNLGITSGETDSLSSSSEEVLERQTVSPLSLQIKYNQQPSSAGTEGERKLDSGTFELSDFKHRQILKHIEDTVKKEDAILEQEHIKAKCNHSSLSDEGFEDQKSLQFINFMHAKKKCQKRRASAARKKRGDELLSMIKLDAMSFTIFDSPSVPYDVYITNYGQGNSIQASVQTGDDNLSEEIQTDNISINTKWTQMPTKFSSFDEKKEHFWNQYKYEYIGSGDEVNTIKYKDDLTGILNENRLAIFLRHSSELILQALSEERLNNVKNLTRSKNELPFSNGYFQLSTKEAIFDNTSVQNISIHPKNIRQVLTVHLKSCMGGDSIKSILCVWDIDDLNSPRIILVSFGEVCCSTFSLDDNNYILAGQKDGAVMIWKISEKLNQYNISSRTPTFITPIGSSHLSKVVVVQSILWDQKYFSEKPENNEVCSLDEAGTIIIWALYIDTDTGTSINNVVVINTHVINLQDIYPQFPDLVCTDCIIMDNHIYVSSNYGFILHYLIRSNQTGIKIFVSETNNDATCLESCPFSQSHFLAGYSNGDISLFSRTRERPLLVLQNKEHIDNASVQIIQWSKTKPFLFYAKDSKNDIHIWDLGKSDMYPEYSISFPEKISCIKHSPVLNIMENEESAYMLIGTEEGKIYFHLLRKEYGQETFELYQEHVKIFLDYVNRL